MLFKATKVRSSRSDISLHISCQLCSDRRTQPTILFYSSDRLEAVAGEERINRNISSDRSTFSQTTTEGGAARSGCWRLVLPPAIAPHPPSFSRVFLRTTATINLRAIESTGAVVLARCGAPDASLRKVVPLLSANPRLSGLW